MSSPSNTAPQQEQQQETPRPQQTQTEAPAEPPQSPSLLDKIVSDSQIASRDALIMRRAEFDQSQRLARMFAKSGCFTDIDKDEQKNWLPPEVSIARAMVKIELGASMGFSAAEAMTGIDIIKGRVAVGASLRGARMQRAGFSWPQMVVNNKGCWMPLCFKGEPMMAPKTAEDGTPVLGPDGAPIMAQVVVSFTEPDARMLGLFDKRESMYLKDPSSMFYARTITRAQRRYGPGVLGVDALDTYEAQEIEPEGPAAEIRRTPPPDKDPRWLVPGSAKAAAAVVEEKLADAERKKNGAAKEDKPAPREDKKADDPAHEEPEERKTETPQDTAPGTVMRFTTWQDIEDQMDPRLGLKVEVADQMYTRSDVSETWTKVAGQAPKPRTVPTFGRAKS